jgi:hypothetical protein
MNPGSIKHTAAFVMVLVAEREWLMGVEAPPKSTDQEAFAMRVMKLGWGWGMNEEDRGWTCAGAFYCLVVVVVWKQGWNEAR